MSPEQSGHRRWKLVHRAARGRISRRRDRRTVSRPHPLGRDGSRLGRQRRTRFRAAPTSSTRLTGVVCGALQDDLRVLLGLPGDRAHRGDEGVEARLPLGLRRLDHQRAGHDQREVDRRRVEAVVHQALADVDRVHAALRLLLVGEDDLVQGRRVVLQVVDVPTDRRGCSWRSGRRRARPRRSGSRTRRCRRARARTSRSCRGTCAGGRSIRAGRSRA